MRTSVNSDPEDRIPPDARCGGADTRKTPRSIAARRDGDAYPCSTGVTGCAATTGRSGLCPSGCQPLPQPQRDYPGAAGTPYQGTHRGGRTAPAAPIGGTARFGKRLPNRLPAALPIQARLRIVSTVEATSGPAFRTAGSALTGGADDLLRIGLDLLGSVFAPCLLGCPGTTRYQPSADGIPPRGVPVISPGC